MKKVIHSNSAPKVVGAYSQAIDTGETVYLSGQIAINPATGRLVDGGAAEQTAQIIKNISAVLEAAELNLDNVVKITAFLADINDYAEFNTVYGQHFSNNPPARSAVGVAALPIGARVEIEAIATREATLS
jgi:2-iminobutanoate/2-iminopropanoate deaminase